MLGNGRRSWRRAGRKGGVEAGVNNGCGFSVEADRLAADKVHDHTAIVFQLEMSNVFRVDHVLAGSYKHRVISPLLPTIALEYGTGIPWFTLAASRKSR